jgi:hypothetical protein
MIANNVNIEEFISVLQRVRSTGAEIIDLEMIPDNDVPSMNKLVLHPVPLSGRVHSHKEETPITIENPKIDTDNNDIFKSFYGSD